MKNDRYNTYKDEKEEHFTKNGYRFEDVTLMEDVYKIIREIYRSETYLAHIAKELNIDHGTARNKIRPLKQEGVIKTKRKEGKTKILEIDIDEIYFAWKRSLIELCTDLKQNISINSDVKNEIENTIKHRNNLDTPIPLPNDTREYDGLELKYYSLHIHHKLLNDSSNEDFKKFFQNYIHNYLENVEKSTIDQMLFADIKDMTLEAEMSMKHHTNMVRQCLGSLLIHHAITDFSNKKNAYREALNKINKK